MWLVQQVRPTMEHHIRVALTNILQHYTHTTDPIFNIADIVTRILELHISAVKHSLFSVSFHPPLFCTSHASLDQLSLNPFVMLTDDLAGLRITESSCGAHGADSGEGWKYEESVFGAVVLCLLPWAEMKMGQK